MDERLNKHLAFVLGISRREADDYIKEGRVKINEAVAKLGARFVASDRIFVDNKPITEVRSTIYLVMNKPVGYVCSRRSQGAPTVYELLPEQYHALKTVGRLDKDSSGLIMLTNDGDFAYQMTHPKFNKIKRYKVRLDRDLEPLHQQMISDYGVKLEDGVSKLHISRISENSRKDWEVAMSEGRNRQIRRTFSSLGYTVKKLHRTNFGPYSIGDIKPGSYTTVDRQGSIEP